MASVPLTNEQVSGALRALPGWRHDAEALVKTFQFGSFKEAMAFMVRVSYEAEAMDHHPEWSNVYNRVVVRLHTHDAGNRVTAKDVALAEKMQHLSWVG